MHPRRGRQVYYAGRPVGVLLLGVALASLLAVAPGCVPPDDDESETTVLEVERQNRQEGDVEGQVGDTLEVFGITATVTEVGRVESYSEFDASGYIWANVRFENTTNRDVPFHRRHWKLEKPDGTISNTTNVSNQTQLSGGGGRTDVLKPGQSMEGMVIYTAGDLEGQFAILYEPDSPSEDPLDVERGVWVFESSPESAG